MGRRLSLVVSNGVRRPDLPEWAGYTITEWHEDGTVTVELDERTELRLLIEEMKAQQ